MESRVTDDFLLQGSIFYPPPWVARGFSQSEGEFDLQKVGEHLIYEK